MTSRWGSFVRSGLVAPLSLLSIDTLEEPLVTKGPEAQLSERKAMFEREPPRRAGRVGALTRYNRGLRCRAGSFTVKMR